MHLSRMAREGYGICWLPESAAQDELAAGRLVHAGGAHWCAELEIWSFKATGNSNPTMSELEKDVP